MNLFCFMAVSIYSLLYFTWPCLKSVYRPLICAVFTASYLLIGLTLNRKMSLETYKIYDLNGIQPIIQGLKLANCMKTDSLLDEEKKKENELITLGKLEDLTVSDTLFCSFCNVNFDHKLQQRQHYKLDWHRYNLKQNLAGQKHVTEDQFLQMADDVSSISGSESESEEIDTENSDTSISPSRNAVASSDTKYKIECADFDQKQMTNSKLQASRHAKVFFENSDGKIISMYRCILLGKKDTPGNFDELVSLATNSLFKTKWGIIMLGGGHFAAAIFEGKEALVHKTFHCYTVRAKQGGSQSSRDGRSSGSHPKSAGASLRRYNEAALTQHVQDIMIQWSSYLDACDLILYRAVGHNRGILFGGRNPPLNKADTRLRTIPFATRRATYGEIRRIHDILSSIEVHGPAELYNTSFPTSPKRKPECNFKETNNSEDKEKSEQSESSPSSDREGRKKNSHSKGIIDRAKPRKSPHRPLPHIVSQLGKSSSESDVHSSDGRAMEEINTEVCFRNDLLEYEDTVPKHIKNGKPRSLKKVKKKQKKESTTEQCSETVLVFRKRLKTACVLGDLTLLQNSLEPISEEPKETIIHSENSGAVVAIPDRVTTEELHKCLNESVDQNGNSLLHIAASKGFCEIIRTLLSAGSNPCQKNKKQQTPYVVSSDKEARNTFRRFLADNPDKYDYSKSMIPAPLTDEIEKEMSEKKRLQHKLKRERQKLRKLEEDKRREEENEKERFLRLSDREKRALAAERRMLANAEQCGGPRPTISRCFQCAGDITGQVPFEYDICRFCSMDCLKKHRAATKANRKS